jgi:hypothetical protein
MFTNANLVQYLPINEQLITKPREVIFYSGKTHNVIGNFDAFFGGSKTFLTHKLS